MNSGKPNNSSAKTQQSRRQSSSFKRQKNNNNSGRGGSGSASRNQHEENRKRILSKALSWVLRHGAPSLGLNMSTDGYIPLDAVLQSSKKLQRYTVDDVRDVVESNDKQRFTLCMKNIMKMKNSDDGDKNVQDFKKYTFVTESNDDNNEGRTMKEEVVLCIRANQGHSITGLVFDELLTPIPPEELEKLDIIIHGTYKAAWENGIRDKGLNRMKRNHIHFARGFPEGKRPTTTSGTEKEKSNVVISGMRNSCELYIYVDGKKCARDGVKFYRSSNEVILTSGITEDGTLPVTYFSKVIDAKSGEDLLK